MKKTQIMYNLTISMNVNKTCMYTCMYTSTCMYTDVQLVSL